MNEIQIIFRLAIKSLHFTITRKSAYRP